VCSWGLLLIVGTWTAASCMLAGWSTRAREARDYRYVSGSI
jgi:hypothetical protein